MFEDLKMPERAHLELRRPVTPYICCTLQDFEDERKHLADVIFPLLTNLCRSRGAYFDPVDLCWTPDDEHAQSGSLLKTLLDSVQSCAPFFMGLLGENYGPCRDNREELLILPRNGAMLEPEEDPDWLKRNLLLAAQAGHSWVLQKELQCSSFTELEVTLAAQSDDSPFFTLYYRRPDYLQEQNCSTSSHDSSITSSESTLSQQKIQSLKQKLVNKGVSIKYFSSTRELGDLVLRDWSNLVDLHLPPLGVDVKFLETIKYNEWLSQETFQESHCPAYIETPAVKQLMQTLSQFALSCSHSNNTGRNDLWSAEDMTIDNPGWSDTGILKVKNSTRFSVLVLSGGRGVGKSALVSNWGRAFRADNPDVCLVSHFVSASRRSMDVRYFLEQCVQKLRKHFILRGNHDSNSLCAAIQKDLTGDSESFQSLCESFIASLALGPCVIVVDGLNDFSTDRQLDWLPSNIPTTCRLVLVAASSDISFSTISQRADTKIVCCPSFPILSNLLPKHVLGGESIIKNFASLKISQTALASSLIANELTSFTRYNQVETFMGQCAELWSVRDLWSLCVERWARDYSWGSTDSLSRGDQEQDCSGWVRDAICLVLLSRNGLRKDQVLNLLTMIGYRGDREVSSYDWMQFRFATRATFLETTDGRLVFRHKYLQDAAEFLFFNNIAINLSDPIKIVNSASLNSRKMMYHKYLARYFSMQTLNTQVMQELPWHLMLSGNETSLVNYLLNCQALLKMFDSEADLWQADLTLFWTVCGCVGHDPTHLYLQLMSDLQVLDTHNLQNQKAGDICEEGDLMEASQNLPVRMSTPNLSRIPQKEKTDSLEQADKFEDNGTLFNNIEDYDNPEVFTAEEIFMTQVDSGCNCQPWKWSVLLERHPASEVARLCLHLSHFLVRTNHSQAGNTLLESLVTFIDQSCPLTSEVYLIQCQSHISLGKHQEARADVQTAEREYRLALESLAVAVSQDDDWTHHQSTQCLKALLLCRLAQIKISQLGLSEAQELLNEALDCVKDCWDCYILQSTVYFHLARLKFLLREFTPAEDLFLESARRWSQWCGDSHILMADVAIHVAQIKTVQAASEMGSLRQAKKLYRRALSIQQKWLGNSHLSTATTLYHLGLLLAGEDSRSAKLEAQELLQQSLDIRTIHLGDNHPQTLALQHLLTQVHVAVHTRKYQLTRPIPTKSCLHKNRKMEPNTRPVSSRSPMTSSLEHNTFDFFQSPQETNKDRPDSYASSNKVLTSASDRLLLVPVKEAPFLYHRSSQNAQGRTKNNPVHLKKSDSLNKDSHQRDIGELKDSEQVLNLAVKEKTTFVSHDKQKSTSLESDLLTSCTESTETAASIPSRHKRRTVSCRPFTALIRFTNENGSHEVKAKLETSAPQRSIRSAPSQLKPGWSGGGSQVTPIASFHSASCRTPGTHDITIGNTQTLTGSFSDITSLLGDPPGPRSSGLQHLSAWYHVPGRYPVSENVHPEKRMQRTQSARKLEALLRTNSNMTDSIMTGSSQQQFPRKILSAPNKTLSQNQTSVAINIRRGIFQLHSKPFPWKSGYPRLILSKNFSSSLALGGSEVPKSECTENIFLQ